MANVLSVSKEIKEKHLFKDYEDMTHQNLLKINIS